MLTSKLLAGYWHNFANSAGVVRLTDIPDAYDIVNIAFATPARGSASSIVLPIMSGYSSAQFADDVRTLQKKGKKVLMSIGGAEATVQLLTRQDMDAFVGSVAALVETYGFDGIDIDFENHSLFLDEGDLDLLRPTTPVIVNLIAALRRLCAHFGSRFILAMAPETFFVQQGFTSYGPQQRIGDSRAGCVLPVIANLRDVITYLWVQQYNSEPIKALDGKIYSAGVPDFHVAMTEMLLRGFSIASDRGGFVAPFDAGQLLVGIPASKEAGAGYLDQDAITEALTYLVTGREFGGTYQLLYPDAYSELRGVMMWSINWDVYAGCQMSKGIRASLDSLQCQAIQLGFPAS